MILADAVADGLIPVNPAERGRGRGRRLAGDRGPERTITDPLGALLIAERAALLSGRDAEFVAVILMMFTGMRWGEVVGLETEYVRPRSIRVEWQLYELGSGEFVRGPPKDGSRRTIDTPAWLSELLAEHISSTPAVACRCHGRRYVFFGRAQETTRLAARPTVAEVAVRAGMSRGTVSHVLNHPERVSAETRTRVEAAMAAPRIVAGAHRTVAHWRRSGFASWVLTPAASGWYPGRQPLSQHPVPVSGTPWAGTPVRGRNATQRADACWIPIARGLTPQGLRHSHRTMLAELGVPGVLANERLGHLDRSMAARYTHVTHTMRDSLRAALTARWEESLAARRQLSPRSAVGALERQLSMRAT
ncbi:LacI family DNA-binding transcriptional regulator [Yinghuangia sp. ASG 101]|uniref:LacI family DNA-binding transcriptional regulator n=1 Tax=Yinghuangia sp. ASG 101 TaxID=2896848 RepID=UPI002F915378